MGVTLTQTEQNHHTSKRNSSKENVTNGDTSEYIKANQEYESTKTYYSGPFIKETKESSITANQQEIENLNSWQNDSFSTYNGKAYLNSNDISEDARYTNAKEDSNNDEVRKLELKLQQENKEKHDSRKSSLVCYTFIWQEDGQNVFVVGSFSNWIQRYQMKKVGNEFVLTLVKSIFL